MSLLLPELQLDPMDDPADEACYVDGYLFVFVGPPSCPSLAWWHPDTVEVCESWSTPAAVVDRSAW